FADEFARANLNLSVVESQANLLHSFKFLAIELISVLEPEKGLQKSLAKIVNDCLLSNSQSTLPENIFRQLMQVRADFAFVLLQRLTEVKSLEPEAKALLAITWNTVRTSGTSLELAMTGNDAGYHRSLLKVLFLALQFHLSTFSGPSSTFETSLSDSQTSNSAKSKASPETTRIVLEIITTLVVPSFRSLTTQLHDDSQRSSSSAADFALITAILQTALRVPGIDRFHTKIVSHLAENQTARYAATLFSWSDQLTVDGDPIYGELSILFFLELSSMPSIAEYLATEGILTHLSNANIMNNFRHPKGSGPFDEPTRLYAVWSRGLLPLCLNLVNGIGAQMAAEIAAFLNQFPNQLARAADSLNSKPPSAPTDPTANYITLAMASEVHSLALISFILDNY
ncbi:MAG: hypothetical protein M1830_007329, partial [Pleopsidium flavum]